MRIIVDIVTDEILSVYQNDDIEETRKNCYIVNTHQIEDFKKVKIAAWKQLKDENGNLMLDDSKQLSQLMGYEVQDKEIKIVFSKYPSFWTIQEVLSLKYKKKLELSGYSGVYFEEFLDDYYNVEGNLSFGKKICYGNGVIKHPFSKLKNNKISFDCEYVKDFPKIEISLDGQDWTRITEVPFSKDFKKVQYSAIYLRLNDFENHLSAYHFFFNGDETAKADLFGRGIERNS